MSSIPLVNETTLRVRFAETDAMGIVHHANYLLYFEIGRIEFTRQAGTPYTALEASGYSLAVGEAKIRYIAPAHFDQLIAVRTRVEDIRSRGITFAYEVLDAATRQLLVTGTTKLVCIDHGGEIRRIPQSWFEAMRQHVTGR